MASSSSLLCLLLLLSAAEAAVDSPLPSPPESSTSALAPILSNLGFQQLALAASFLPSPLLSSPWSPPITIFAPSDDSVRACGPSCSSAHLLTEHTVIGVFPLLYLSKLTSGTKLETSSPDRCLTVTSTTGSDSSVKILADGVEITRPDLFNDGNIVIHGISAVIAPLSPFSCIYSLTTSEVAEPSVRSEGMTIPVLDDAILRLAANGYSFLALAMRVKSAELLDLKNMTVFAVDDRTIFSGGQVYVTDVRFHVVPNKLLMRSDLARLPTGVVIPTLVSGKHLAVTQSGEAEVSVSGLRINYMPIKEPEVVSNSKIVVHSVFFPFPHLYLMDQAYEDGDAIWEDHGDGSACSFWGSLGDCMMAPSPAPASSFGHHLNDDDGLDLHLYHDDGI